MSGETVLNGSSAAVQNAQNAANQTVLNGASSTGKVGKLTQKVN